MMSRRIWSASFSSRLTSTVISRMRAEFLPSLRTSLTISRTSFALSSRTRIRSVSSGGNCFG